MNYEFKSVLFLGIGGVSMHQLALAFKSLGVKVFGYDLHASKYTKICEENGFKEFEIKEVQRAESESHTLVQMLKIL